MTLEARELVQDGWDCFAGTASAAWAAAFYEHLVDLDPQLGRLFRGTDMGEQGRTLVRTLGEIVRGLGEEWKRAPVAAPARPDDAWGSPQHAVVGTALIETLAQVLGERFTPGAHAAWAELFATHAAEIRHAALGDAGTSRVVPLRRRRLVEIGS